MKIRVQEREKVILGERGKGIDWEKSGKHLMGLFYNLQGVAILHCKCYTNSKRWDVLDNWTSTNLNIDNIVDKYNKLCNKSFDNQYDKYIFGNEMSQLFCKEKLSLNNLGEPYSGFEVVKADLEYLFLAVQGSIHKIKFAENIKDSWMEELSNFDLKNPEKYVRTLALGTVLIGANVDDSVLFF
ncbi:MAG: hypothetical protein AAFS12_04705 [Cyanobacteria bacterium J06632_19]